MPELSTFASFPRDRHRWCRGDTIPLADKEGRIPFEVVFPKLGVELSIVGSVASGCERASCPCPCHSPSMANSGLGQGLVAAEEVPGMEHQRRDWPMKDVATRMKKREIGASIEEVNGILVVEVSPDKGSSLIFRKP